MSTNAREQKTKKQKKKSTPGLASVLRALATALDSELTELEQMPQVEQAYWSYLDDARRAHPSLPYMNQSNFAVKLLALFNIPPEQAEEANKRYVKMQEHRPVCGSILFDPTLKQVLMVRGKCKGCPLGFPKGKLEPEESLLSCAMRETLEETGVNCSAVLSEEACVTLRLNRKDVTLFYGVLPAKPKKLKPQVRNEIKSVEWVDCKKLAPGACANVSQNMAAPFHAYLKDWASLSRHTVDKPSKPNKQKPKPTKVTKQAAKHPVVAAPKPKPAAQTAHWCLHHACLGSHQYFETCLLYTSPSPRDRTRSRMPSSA
eukprot:TRINITY_DN749_c0_g1_i1.p1 TRINITY_DN749_c0_g1~~TRINITY_DN749_c0_g1_i1.p1  ORF type:complete len:316 (+),score=77.09 TRINITY_DN749_c0_g1_i1:183-1130(+)